MFRDRPAASIVRREKNKFASAFAASHALKRYGHDEISIRVAERAFLSGNFSDRPPETRPFVEVGKGNNRRVFTFDVERSEARERLDRGRILSGARRGGRSFEGGTLSNLRSLAEM